MDFRLEIEKIYIAYFNRPADNGGLTYWLEQVGNDPAKLENITAAFATVPEYLALYAGKTPEAVVNTIYQNLFGRAPDAGGFQFWTGALKSGSHNVSDLAYRTLDSAQLSDKTIIDNKAGAALEFTKSLSDLGGDTHYNGAAIDAARAWLARIDATPQSVTAANAEITTVVKGFDGSQPQPEPQPEPLGPARVFTFTIGWDQTQPGKGVIAPFEPLENKFPPHRIDDFVLGHDKIEIVDLNGNSVDISGPTWNYVHAEHTGAPGLNYQFSLFGALAFAHNGGKAQTLDALMPWESVLITYQDAGGKARTLLFIDDGEAGRGEGMDNGLGVAVLNIYSDVVIDVTGLVGLKTSADQLQVAGSFFA